jgi:hypothetical protein
MPAYSHATISAGELTADVYLPDAERAFYCGTRFDRSGVIGALRYRGHEYFGQWKDFHDPLFHDCITGPAEEFEAADTPDHDFQRAPEGTPFLRLGVGLLQKVGDGDFRRFYTYPVVDDTGWHTSIESGQIVFDHAVSSPTGLSYQYRKALRLDAQAPVLRMEHTLANTGRIPIVTRHYNHNFFRIDGLLPGPSLFVIASFPLSLKNPVQEPLVIEGCKASLSRELSPGESVLAEALQQNQRYEIDIFQQATSAGVRICADRPIARLLLWASNRVFCPEPYIDIRVPPGECFSWNLSYTFYVNDSSSLAP